MAPRTKTTALFLSPIIVGKSFLKFYNVQKIFVGGFTYIFRFNPYNRVTGCLSVYLFVCLIVPKDFDMVLLYRVASHRTWEGL